MAKEAEQNDAKTFKGIVDMCTFMHNSVRDKSTAYLEEMRRYNYVTSTSYLELINVIKLVLVLRADTLAMKLKGLTVGLDKLKSTKSIIADLKAKLAANQPVLERTTIQVKEQQAQIAQDKEAATIVQAEAEASSAAAAKKAGECAEIKASAEAGLAEALPALEMAVKCLAKVRAPARLVRSARRRGLARSASPPILSSPTLAPHPPYEAVDRGALRSARSLTDTCVPCVLPSRPRVWTTAREGADRRGQGTQEAARRRAAHAQGRLHHVPDQVGEDPRSGQPAEED